MNEMEQQINSPLGQFTFAVFHTSYFALQNQSIDIPVIVEIHRHVHHVMITASHGVLNV